MTLSAVATHGGRKYYTRLGFRFTWRGHTYTGTEKFTDPCGNTTGCWVTPGTRSHMRSGKPFCTLFGVRY